MVFFNNSLIEPSNTYVYDALYRLVLAEGREHAVQNIVQRDAKAFETIAGIPFPNSPEALQRYTEAYKYDPVGNILEFRHTGGDVERWIRRYQYALDSNRLLATRLPGEAANLPDYAATPSYGAKYTYDAHGNMTAMPHLKVMEWDFKDQLHATQQQVVNNGIGEKTYYVYDAGGQRVRKVTETQNGKPKDERLYLGGFEVYRKYNGNGQTVVLERETLHIMDDKQRVALVETRTRLQGDDPAPRQLVRFQLGNHLGSAALELDDQAQVISYEEYHPYGSTAYHAARSQTETPKRYRYTGKERDEETGLSYHRARYYAPWLGRWTAADPAGTVAGVNFYLYSAASPVCLTDPDGLAPVDKHDIWQEGPATPSSSAPAKSTNATAPVEPDIVMEVPITGPPIDASKGNRGFDKDMGRIARQNRARMAGTDPSDYHIAHSEKAHGITMPGEKQPGVPTRATPNLEQSGPERVEQTRRNNEAKKAGQKASEKTNPEEFARPGEKEHANLVHARKEAEKAGVPKQRSPLADSRSSSGKSPCEGFVRCARARRASTQGSSTETSR